MPDRLQLSQEDVARLLSDPTPEVRVATATKLAQNYGVATLSTRERRLAEQIFRLMLRDAELRVRQTLSRQLKDNPALPSELALTMARDVADVAGPILQFSTVLTDDDLVSIVVACGEDHQTAIAGRAVVSETVSDALVNHGNEGTVTTLMANSGARITEQTLQSAIDRFAESTAVSTAMTHRASLPIGVAQRLVNQVSDALRQHLVTHHALPADVASDLILQARERAILGLVSDDEASSAQALVDELFRGGRLTPTLLLRALCLGDLDFFEAAIAKLAGIPVANAHILLSDRSEGGLQALFAKTKLPQSIFPFVRGAVHVVHETDYDGGLLDRERFRSKVLERVLTSFEGGFDSDSLDYLVARIGVGGDSTVLLSA